MLDKTAHLSHTYPVANRREKFREYMSRLDAAADPRYALERGFYVPRPGLDVTDRLVGRLELQPASTHLIVGGIGTGKTTQLLVAQDRLKAIGDTAAIYIDVSKHQNIDKLKPGVLLALAGIELCNLLPKGNKERAQILSRFNGWAYGYEDIPDQFLHDDAFFRPGVLTPPSLGLDDNIEEMSDALDNIRQMLADKIPHIVLLFDSLDRLSSLEGFSKVVKQDISLMASIGIGTVVIGPIRAIYGIQRLIAERFQYNYHQSSVDTQQDSAGREFLLRILQLRTTKDLLSDATCRQLIDLSGGILRDLISLARQSVEEAYLSGSEAVEWKHVAAAADAFGRSLMIGLRPNDIDVLQRVRKDGAFVETSEDDLALLVTRRVLEYQASGLRYAVHPTLEPLLKQIAGET